MSLGDDLQRYRTATAMLKRSDVTAEQRDYWLRVRREALKIKLDTQDWTL